MIPTKIVTYDFVIKSQENPNNIFNNVCPDIILAKSLIDKLNTLDIKDINSIKTKPNDITKGTPFGNSSLKILSLWYLTPTIITAIKVIKAKKKLNTK